MNDLIKMTYYKNEKKVKMEFILKFNLKVIRSNEKKTKSQRMNVS